MSGEEKSSEGEDLSKGEDSNTLAIWELAPQKVVYPRWIFMEKVEEERKEGVTSINKTGKSNGNGNEIDEEEIGDGD